MMPKIPVTCCIPTLNEEKNIKRCIESILWADEIIVLDSGSSDNTVEIAKSLGAKIYVRNWDNTANQFSYLFSLAKNEWVLHLDADEVCSEKLINEIKRLFEVEKFKDFSAFQINRKTFFFGTLVKYCGIYPDFGVRLFRKNRIKLTNKGFHHRILVDGLMDKLSDDAVIFHYTATDFAQYLDKIKRESSEMAMWRFKNNERFSMLKLIFKSFFNFFKSYVLKLGFLDGKTGFIISVFNSIYIALQYIKLWEIEKQVKK